MTRAFEAFYCSGNIY